MGQDFSQPLQRRRFPRAPGPFDGYQVGPQTPVLIYNLNLGGGLVNFASELPAEVDFVLKVALPAEGVITVHAETVYRHESSIAVRFVDLDHDTYDRLARAVDASIQQPLTH